MMKQHPLRPVSLLSAALILTMLASCGAPGGDTPDPEEFVIDLTDENTAGEYFSEHNVYAQTPDPGSFDSDQTDQETGAPIQNPDAPYADGEAVVNPMESGIPAGSGTVDLELPVDEYAEQEIEIPEGIEGEIEEPSKIKSAVSGASKKKTLLKNKGDFFYYYTKLSKDEKKIYKGIKSVLLYPDSTERGIPILIKTVPASADFNEAFQNAHLALMYDHPEFYFSYQKTTFKGVQYYYDRFPDSDGFYEIQFVLKEPYPYYKKEVTAFNKAVKKIMDSLDLTRSEANIALQIHDKLLASCSYNYAAATPAPTYARTAYGAIVTHDPICVGYAAAFTYLMQQAGLKAITVSGNAGTTKADAGGHSWNLVKIGANWYEVDATWDDREPASNWYNCSAGAALAKDAAAMYRVTHYLFMVPTNYINNFKYSGNYKYSLRNGAWFIPMGNSVHLRATKKTDLLIETKAPKAYGTYYMQGANCQAGAAIDTLIDDGQVFAESNTRKLTNDDLKLLRRNKYHTTETMTKMAINELYARRGFIFSSANNKKFYSSYHWYKAKTKDKKAVRKKFNKYEEYNLKLLNKFLAKL